MKIYIKSSSLISSAPTFGVKKIEALCECSKNLPKKTIEPDYKEWIDPRVSRRMSRLIKMVVTAAKSALKDSEVEKPDAIIAGTALGCIEDTETFLSGLITNQETLLNPAPFIQSTHNTPSSTVAILLGCNSYNGTYAHRNNSFETALLDSCMQIEDGSENVLCMGFDEITKNSEFILKRLRIRGETALSENTGAFVLGKNKGNASAQIDGIMLRHTISNSDEFEKLLDNFLNINNKSMSLIDLILRGTNGGKADDEMAESVCRKNNMLEKCFPWKYLLGENFSSGASALWIAQKLIEAGVANDNISNLLGISPAPMKNILIHNSFMNKNHSFILVSGC